MKWLSNAFARAATQDVKAPKGLRLLSEGLIKGFKVLVMLATLAFVASILHSCSIVWSYDHLERNAEKVITAAELQAWATNVLAQYPATNRVGIPELGTNIPKALLGLTSHHIGPDIRLVHPENTNLAPCVRVIWGSGFLGASEFEIGPTNFIDKSGTMWAPGVYFLRH